MRHVVSLLLKTAVSTVPRGTRLGKSNHRSARVNEQELNAVPGPMINGSRKTLKTREKLNSATSGCWRTNEGH